ncbi:MAG: alpha/beta hydrolase [Azoarcus sp.]|jgi:alpha/beta superfamily hydrolase|nr:alpha/beta hydrolase [Azoarcus sp.]
MNRPFCNETVLVPGAAGQIEVLIDTPDAVRGIALVCHPHPLFGGTNGNKVVYTLARAFRDLGYVSLRPNFRSVGRSEGAHDHGDGETQDMQAVLAWAQRRWGDLPVVLGGFSFGAYVQMRLANCLAAAAPPRYLVLVGTAAGMAGGGMTGDGSMREYETPTVPKGVPALLIHGEIDDVVPLANVLDWARPQELPVVVLPGADHFFHGRLGPIRKFVARIVAPAGA